MSKIDYIALGGFCLGLFGIFTGIRFGLRARSLNSEISTLRGLIDEIESESKDRLARLANALDDIKKCNSDMALEDHKTDSFYLSDIEREKALQKNIKMIEQSNKGLGNTLKKYQLRFSEGVHKELVPKYRNPIVELEENRELLKMRRIIKYYTQGEDGRQNFMADFVADALTGGDQ